jgi:putative transposase
MSVLRGGYYRWLKSPKTKREEENEQLSERLIKLFNKGRGNYGTRRLKKEFALLSLNVSRRRIGRLMEQAGLACKTKRKFKATTDSRHTKPIAPNVLDRQFEVSQQDRYYVGDITYSAPNLRRYH